MNKQIVLDRVNLIGSIEINTPWCVTSQIIESLGFKATETSDSDEYSKLIAKIDLIRHKKRQSLTINQDFTIDEAPVVARFVNGNSNINWGLKTLDISFNHLVSFDPRKACLDNIIVGYKTQDQPLAYDPSMLYQICKFNQIQTSLEMTVDQMVQAIKLYTQQPELVRNQIIDIVKYMNPSKLFRLRLVSELAIVNSPNIRIDDKDRSSMIHSKAVDLIPSNCFTNSELMTTYSKITQISHLLNRVIPNNHQESIILGAMIYGVNLNDCTNPTLEFNQLRLIASISEAKTYIPIEDPLFRVKYITNPDWYDVRKNWEPRLSCIYTRENIFDMAVNEGFKNGDPNSFILKTRSEPTFYSGIHPNSITNLNPEFNTVIYRDNPLDLLDQIVSYGIVDTNSFVFYTFDELVETFERNKNFCNPAEPGKIFSSTAITKLNNICHKYSITKSPNMIAKVTQLIKIIKTTERYNSEINQSGRKIRELCLNKTNLELIKTYFKFVFDVGMFMRGWKVTRSNFEIDINTLPIKAEETQTHPNSYPLIMINVSQSIILLEDFISQSPSEVRVVLESCPLMKKMIANDTVSFVPSLSADEGITIIDRINICKSGISPLSCIRTSSNHLLSSAYYYSSIVMGLEPIYEIKLLANIS